MSINKHFPFPLLGEYLGRNRWQLIAPFEYRSKIYGNFIVPTGFIVDGASIPRAVQPIIGSPWSGKYGRPSVLHDWLYHIKHPRKESDLIFLQAMRICKVPYWKRKAMYIALRGFGFISFNNKK